MQKSEWLHQQPLKLYDICIKYLVNNLNKILINEKLNKIKLNSTICDSILNEYNQVYDKRLRIQERNDFNFINKINRKKRLKSQIVDEISSNDDTLLIITYYNLLVELAKHSKQFQLSKIVYKQCLKQQTPLSKRLKSTDLFQKYRDLNRAHLDDDDFLNYFIAHKNLEYLDVCSCLLTNKFLKMLNDNLKNLKYLRIQNYCDYCTKHLMSSDDDDDEDTRVGIQTRLHNHDADLNNHNNEDDGNKCKLFSNCVNYESTYHDLDEFMSNHVEYGDNDDECEESEDDIENEDLNDEMVDIDQNEAGTSSTTDNQMQIDDTSTTSTSDDDDDDEQNDEYFNKRSYSRLMRHYRFLNNTNLSSQKPSTSTSAASATTILTTNINLIKNLLNHKLLAKLQNVGVSSTISSLVNSCSNAASTLTQSIENDGDNDDYDENRDKRKMKKFKKSLKNPIKNKKQTLKNKMTTNLYSLLTSILNNKRNFDQKFTELLNTNDNNKTFMNEEEAAQYLINLQLRKQVESDEESDVLDTKMEFQGLRQKQYVLKLNNLQYLSLNNLACCLKNTILNEILVNLNEIKYLDLTNSCVDPKFDDIIQDLKFKQSLQYLQFTNFNANDLNMNVNFICSFKNLKYLDLSNYRETVHINIYKNASFLLSKICFLLKNLQYLDISGTNLGGPALFKINDEILYLKRKLKRDLIQNPIDNLYEQISLEDIENFNFNINSSIIGLSCLNVTQLEFLGCINCENNVSGRSNLPAKRIAGIFNEADLFTSLEVYMDRPLYLLDILNHLFELYRENQIEDKLLGGSLIMDCMVKYLDNARIQISGSASLFYVLKYSKDDNKTLPYFYLKRLIDIIIMAMEEHIDESAMRRNCVLIVCRLNLPDDVLFVSDRLINILLKIFDDYIEEKLKQQQQQTVTNNNNNNNDRPEPFVLRTAMHLLNILACSVHGTDKSSVGALAIPVAMDLIRTKIQNKEADEILEVTWSFLWNITDETPENCRIFLDECNGMNVFMDCIQFKRPEIIRNMMGLLGNVSEVKELRNRLIKDELIATFRQLLFNNSDGIEIPYNSAGVLAHIMSDGDEIWRLSCNKLERTTIINDLQTAIDNWDIKSERNINYRSFEPIFRLVTDFNNPICQQWSCWALANLTSVYPETYCTLLVKENGHVLLKDILENKNVNMSIKNYAGIVIDNLIKYGHLKE